MANNDYVPTYKNPKPTKTLFMSPIFVKRNETQPPNASTPTPMNDADVPTKDKSDTQLPPILPNSQLKIPNRERTTQTSKTIIQLAKLQQQLNSVNVIEPCHPDLSHLDIDMVERYSIKPEKDYYQPTKTRSYDNFHDEIRKVKNFRLNQWMDNIVTQNQEPQNPQFNKANQKTITISSNKKLGPIEIGEFTPVFSIYDSAANTEVNLPSIEVASAVSENFCNNFRSQSLVESKRASIDVPYTQPMLRKFVRDNTEHRSFQRRVKGKPIVPRYHHLQKFPNFCSTSMIESSDCQRYSPHNGHKKSENSSFMWPTLSSEQKSLKQQVECVKGLMGNKFKTNSASFTGEKVEVPYSTMKPQVVKSEDLRASVNKKKSPTMKKIATIFSTSTIEGTNSSVMENDIFLILNRVKSTDFSNALKALADIIDTASNISPDLISPYMTIINQRLLELLKSPRSHVARTSCQLAGHFFQVMKDTRRPEFDDIVNILLFKTADACKHIRQDANLALDTMVTHIPTFHAIRSICAKGPTHRNPLTRCAAIRLIICAIVIAGPTAIMHNPCHDATRKRIYDNMLFFLEDKHGETRKYAERLYMIMHKEGTFDYFAKRYLNRTKYDALLAAIKSTKKAM